MSGDAELMLVIAGMHLLGIVCAAALIIPALRSDQLPRRGDHGSDGGWGQPLEKPPTPGRPQGGLPLPDAVQSRVRLRDHRRISQLLPRRARRPAREPERAPERVPQ